MLGSSMWTHQLIEASDTLGNRDSKAKDALWSATPALSGIGCCNEALSLEVLESLKRAIEKEQCSCERQL